MLNLQNVPNDDAKMRKSVLALAAEQPGRAAEVCSPLQDADFYFPPKLLRTGDTAASGATFEMQIFDHHSSSLLGVGLPLPFPPNTCLSGL